MTFLQLSFFPHLLDLPNKHHNHHEEEKSMNPGLPICLRWSYHLIMELYLIGCNEISVVHSHLSYTVLVVFMLSMNSIKGKIPLDLGIELIVANEIEETACDKFAWRITDLECIISIEVRVKRLHSKGIVAFWGRVSLI